MSLSAIISPTLYLVVKYNNLGTPQVQKGTNKALNDIG